MKYYKLINQEGHSILKKGQIYAEDYKPNNGADVAFYRDVFPKDFEKVPESEYLLQEARRKYPVGTRFVDYWSRKETSECEPFFYQDGKLNIAVCKTGGVVYTDGKWAEIVSTPKEEKSSFHTGEYHEPKQETMTITHEYAIKILAGYSDTDDADLNEACDYAINQLKQYEVYPEPVDMEVSNSEFEFYGAAKVSGYFKGKCMVYDKAHHITLYDYCRPIKKEPLSFGHWFKQEYPNDTTPGVFLLNDLHTRYQSYLKDFEK